MFVDYVLNGEGHGPIGEGLSEVRFEPGLLRPFKNSKGQTCFTVNTGKKKTNPKTKKEEPVFATFTGNDLRDMGINSPVMNATGLSRDSWVQIDTRVVRAMRQRLRAWTDLERTSTVGGFNAMGKLVYEYEATSDPGEALVDMDGLADGRTDSPLHKLRGLPLPITHSDFWFSQRRINVSRNGGTPLDTTMAEAAGRRVAEMVERTLIGVETGMAYGTRSSGFMAHDNTSQVYGYTNLPARITKTNVTVPTGSNPEATVNDILTMRETMYANKFYGPYIIYHSTDWDRFLDNDYARLGGDNASMTLRDRIRKIGVGEEEDGGGQIRAVRRLDFLTSTYTLIMVQMTPDVAQAINGMEATTVMWPSQGGMRQNFKVMCIKVPLLRYDYNGVAGILHATTA